MWSILIWWAVPAAAALLAALVITVARRVRAARGDVETGERYQKAREALARAASEGVAARSRQE